MEQILIETILKNGLTITTIVIIIILAIVAIYRYFVAQSDKKDQAIAKKDDTIKEVYNEFLSQRIEHLSQKLDRMSDDIRANTQETSESNKLLSNFLVMWQERKKP